MKKRLFSLAIALVLCVGLIAPASAAQTPSIVWLDEGLAPAVSLVFNDGLLAVTNTNWKHGFVDTTGKVVIPLQFNEAKNFYEGLAAVKNGDDMWGYIDKAGKLVIPYQYNYAGDFSEGLAVVSGYTEDENGDYTWGYGYIDRTGKLVVPMKYDSASYFSEGLAAVKKDLRWGYVDTTGKEVIPLIYFHAGFFQSGIAAVHSVTNKKWGYIDKTGQYVIEPTLSCFETHPFYDGANLAIIRNGNYGIFKCGFVNKDGEVVIPRTYDDAKPFYEGLAMVAKGDVYMSQGGMRGYIDESGNVVIPLEYSEATIFSEGLAAVKKDGKAGYINKTGQVVIPLEYDNAYEVNEGKALVQKNGRWGILSISADFAMPTVGGFTDVKESDYFADAVLWAVEKNITSGTSVTTFSPNATCNRAQILTFLWRANGSPEPTNANPFTDIKTSDYYYTAALWAAEKGLVSGNTFGANTDCTRAMTVEYLWKAAGSPAPSGKSSFTDVPTNADYASAVAWAVEQNITSGTGGSKFSPDTTCTRGQIVTFLHRAMG